MLVKLQGEIISSNDNEILVNVINENDIEIENLNKGKFQKINRQLLDTKDDTIEFISNNFNSYDIKEIIKELTDYV